MPAQSHISRWTSIGETSPGCDGVFSDVVPVLAADVE